MSPGRKVIDVKFMDRMAALVGLVRDAETPEPARPMMIAPHDRSTLGWTAGDRALSLSTVYRGIQIHSTSAIQLGVDVYRAGRKIATPGLVRRPDVDEDSTREAFVEYTVNCLWLTGDAFWRKVRAPLTGEIVSLRPLNPNEVTVQLERPTDRPIFHYRNEVIPTRDIKHLKMLRVPGYHRGLGPIQAARLEIEGALDARDYGSTWFTESGMPSGVLTTTQTLTPEMAQTYKTLWNENTGHETRVLGDGLAYAPLLLKPADVQFLESQQFNTTQIARLLGVPASLLLAAVQGQSRTYSNVIEEWRGYIQFSAMKALREIESAWSSVLPGEQTVRFNFDSFLRLDTKSRYEAHRTGIEAGFLSVNEVRALEGLDPIAGGEIPTRSSSTTKEPTNADV